MSPHITFDGDSRVTFRDNKANNDGGGIHCLRSCNVTFKGNTNVEFNYNKAGDWGGAVFGGPHCNIQFYKISSVIFINNIALSAGAISSQGIVSADGKSTITIAPHI